MKTALLRLVSSMKFWTWLLGTMTALGAKYGFHVDPEVYWSIVGLTGVLLGAQGLNDQGKGKAEVEARSIQSGFAALDVLVYLVAVGSMVGLLACGWTKGEAKHAAAGVADCMKPELAGASHELASVLEKSVPTVISDTGKVDRAGFKSLISGLTSDAAGCAITTVVARFSQPRDQGAPFASPLTIDAADLQSTWAEVDRDQFGGRTFQVKDGS